MNSKGYMVTAVEPLSCEIYRTVFALKSGHHLLASEGTIIL